MFIKISHYYIILYLKTLLVHPQQMLIKISHDYIISYLKTLLVHPQKILLLNLNKTLKYSIVTVKTHGTYKNTSLIQLNDDQSFHHTSTEGHSLLVEG